MLPYGMGQLFEHEPFILESYLPLGGMNINVNHGRMDDEQYDGNRKSALGQISVIAALEGIT
jgi:hypothetical protein